MDYQDPDWVAERLGIDKNTVYRFLQEGTIPAVQLGRKWLISQRRLEEWLAAETEKQTRARREAAKSAESVVRRMDQFTAPARAALKKRTAKRGDTRTNSSTRRTCCSRWRRMDVRRRRGRCGNFPSRRRSCGGRSSRA